MRTDTHESGMTNGGRERIERLVREFGYTAVGKATTIYGEVFIAEKAKPEGYEVVWASRDMAQPLLCGLFTDPKKRVHAAVKAATDQLKVRNGVYREI